jgi:hypothetical protein
MYGEIHICDHDVYDSCTLFKMGNRGLAVIQQRFDPHTKQTWWSEIDPWLTDTLYLHPKFKEIFNDRSGECDGGTFPTITIRQLMWALKMKPLPKARWETCFDRKSIYLFVSFSRKMQIVLWNEYIGGKKL